MGALNLEPGKDKDTKAAGKAFFQAQMLDLAKEASKEMEVAAAFVKQGQGQGKEEKDFKDFDGQSDTISTSLPEGPGASVSGATESSLPESASQLAKEEADKKTKEDAGEIGAILAPSLGSQGFHPLHLLAEPKIQAKLFAKIAQSKDPPTEFLKIFDDESTGAAKLGLANALKEFILATVKEIFEGRIVPSEGDKWKALFAGLLKPFAKIESCSPDLEKLYRLLPGTS